MSYYFTVKGATKALALAAAAQAMDAIVKGQAPHKADRDLALKNAENMVGTLREPNELEVVVVTMNGSLGGTLNWNGGEEPQVITSASASCSANIGMAAGT